MSNKFQTTKFLRIWGMSTLSVAIICVILRLLSHTFFYDSLIGYYTSGAIIPFFAQFLPLAFVAVMLVFSIVPALRVRPNKVVVCKQMNILSVFPASGFTAYAVCYLITVYKDLQQGFALGFIGIVSIIATICSAVFFWLIFVGKTGSGIYVGMGIALLVHMLFILAESYFNTQVQMNSPNKTVFQFAVLSAMLLIVNELRIGQPVKKPMFHLFSASSAVVFTALSSIPSIISYFAGNMPRNYTLLFYDITLLFFAVYAVARLCQLCLCTVGDRATEDCSDTSIPTSDEE